MLYSVARECERERKQFEGVVTARTNSFRLQRRLRSRVYRYFTAFVCCAVFERWYRRVLLRNFMVLLELAWVCLVACLLDRSCIFFFFLFGIGTEILALILWLASWIDYEMYRLFSLLKLR